jgi:hypothetical protein
MPKTQYTRETYDLLLEFYRQNGGKFTEASRAAGCSLKVARSAWSTGWRGLVWAEPIEQRLVQEQEAARAKRLTLEREELERQEMVRRQAREDAIEARTKEAQMAKLSRGNATLFAAHTLRMLKSLNMVVQEFDRRVSDVSILQAMSSQELRKWVDTVTGSTKDAAQIVRMALEIERIVTGQPIALLGLQVSEMTPVQLMGELERIQGTLAKYNALPGQREIEDAEYEAIPASGSSIVSS